MPGPAEGWWHAPRQRLRRLPGGALAGARADAGAAGLSAARRRGRRPVRARRCRASWDRVRRADDVDVHVYRTVLACRRDRLRRPWWEEPAPTGTTRPLDDDRGRAAASGPGGGPRPADPGPAGGAGAAAAWRAWTRSRSPGCWSSRRAPWPAVSTGPVPWWASGTSAARARRSTSSRRRARTSLARSERPRRRRRPAVAVTALVRGRRWRGSAPGSAPGRRTARHRTRRTSRASRTPPTSPGGPAGGCTCSTSPSRCPTSRRWPRSAGARSSATTAVWSPSWPTTAP